ncbi:MAG: branched-chain amino acid ABC transporter substrate-binding protein [Chloroflexia bacterium]
MLARAIRTVNYITALVLALGLFGCDSGQTPPPYATVTPITPVSATPIYTDSETFRIISSLPHKGYAAQQTRQIEQAIQLALDGKSQEDYRVFEYIALDSSDDETGEWSPAKETANVERAVADPRVVAYIGPYASGGASIVLPIANKANLLVASPSVTWPGLSLSGYNPGEPDIYYPNGTQNFLGMMPDDSQMGMAAADWATKLGSKKIAVLDDGSTYSKGIAKEFSKSFSGGLGDMSSITLSIAPPDISNLPSQLARYDAIFYAPSSVNNASLVARTVGPLNLPIFSTDVALDPQFIDGAGSFAANWHIVSNSVPASRLFDDVDQASANIRNALPGQFAVNAYNIATLIAQVVQPEFARDNPGGAFLPLPPNREGITRDIRSTDQEGIAGRLYFNYAGRPKFARMSGYQMIDGKFKLTEIFTVTRP